MIINAKKIFLVLSAILTSFGNLLGLYAQDKLYPNTFPLSDVKLLDSPFKQALDLNIQTLLQYDTDRLLAPYLKEAGLPPKAGSFPNWIGLDGHIGGHYLSALAISFSATRNAECKRRMDYMLAELKRCQAANGDGYLGGVPNGKTEIWDKIKAGDPKAVRKVWVPWYNLHKTYAGLRDAWLYGGSGEAKTMFLKFCDWGLSIIAPLSDEQMEMMLYTEFGGMNEIFADAFQMTKEQKYLDAAKRFSHRQIFDAMAAQRDNLDNKHANTQVPKAVGYQRVAELSGNKDYTTAAGFFWETVTENRSLSLGGNSRREHFPTDSDCVSYIEEREGPETCNTNNMLKLTEGLFRMNPQAKYADYYERALYNHILSSQHPAHGGYVYFTPARPRHYRVYSATNEAMWCCVGTGMENHGKYGEFIYTHNDNSLYINLFIASELNWKEKNIVVAQNTQFPDEEKTVLIIKTEKPKKFKLLIRHPEWLKGVMKIEINGKIYQPKFEKNSYIEINRKWSNGDVVTIPLPMENRLETMPNVPGYVSLMHGPILLATRTGTEDLTGLVADDSRWAHIAHGKLLPINEAPFSIGTKAKIQEKISQLKSLENKQLNFSAEGLFADKKYDELIFEPFFRIHDSRYLMCWNTMTADEYKNHRNALAEIEREKLSLDERTIDRVTAGEQQPEADHLMQSENSNAGYASGESYRDATNGWFSYTLATGGERNLTLMLRYWGNESGNRTFDILIDGEILVTENIHRKARKSEFVNIEYPIPEAMLQGKTTITLRIAAKNGNTAGGVYSVRLLKNKK